MVMVGVGALGARRDLRFHYGRIVAPLFIAAHGFRLGQWRLPFFLFKGGGVEGLGERDWQEARW